jgi:hypothetical protein
MFALLKKDWRLNAVPIFGGTLLVATPYIVVLLAELSESRRDRGRYLADNLRIAAIMGTILTVAITAVFGGAAFALERRERSADFLAMLPVARRKIVLSKAIIGAGCCAALWAINFFAFHEADAHATPGPAHPITTYGIVICAAEIMIPAFGIAWFASVFLSSPSIAACIAIGAVVLLTVFELLLPMLLFALLDQWLSEHSDGWTVIPMIALPPVCGIIFFVAGTLHYLRRIEP